MGEAVPAAKPHPFSVGNPRLGAIRPAIVDLARLHGRFRRRHGVRASTGVGRIELAGGTLLLDGRPVIRPVFADGTVRWSDQTAAGFSGGFLHSTGGGLFLTGTLAAGPDVAGAHVEHVFFAIEPLAFSTRVARGSSIEAITAWQAGPEVIFDISVDPAAPPSVAAKVDGVAVDVFFTDAGDPLAASLSLAVQAQTLNLAGLRGTGHPEPSDAAMSTVEVAFDGRSFTGILVPLDQEASPLFWKGTAIETGRPVQPAALAAIAQTPAVDGGMGIADLIVQSTANAAPRSKACFSAFIMYWMDDGTRTALFGSPKPDFVGVTAQEIAARDATPDLFTTWVCPAFIVQQLSGLSKEQGGPSDPLSDGDIWKLRYFWENDLALKPGYNELSARLTQVGYGSNPRLQRYMDDDNGNWAQQLYDAVITDDSIRVTILSFIATHDPAALTRYAELLLALSPLSDQQMPDGTACTYATKYHIRLMQKLGLMLGVRMGAVDKSLDALETWLPDWLDSYRQMLEGQINAPGILPADKGRLQTEADALDAEVARCGSYAAFASTFIGDLKIIQGSSLFQRLQAWAATNRYAAPVMKLLAVGSFVFSLVTTIFAFKNWDILDKEKRAEAIVGLAQLSTQLVDMVPADLGSLFKSDGEINIPEPEALYTPLDAELFRDGGEADLFSEMSDWVASDMRFAEIGGFDIFVDGARVFKAFGVLTAAASLAFSTYQVVEDFEGQSGTAQKVLDFFGVGAGALMLAGGMAEMGLLSAGFTCLGPIGAALGIVLALVSLFLPGPPPDRPADDYMKDHGTAFLASLHNPTDDWKKAHGAAASAFVP